MQYQKPHAASKITLPKGEVLDKIVSETLQTITDLVGSTLGPGGNIVLIERQELNLQPILTKDGVTVFRSIGFKDPIAQIVLEAAREASVKTADSAGDGTSSATILANAFYLNTRNYLKSNPTVSPQSVTRQIQQIFNDKIEPFLKSLALKADLDTEEGRNALKAVARVSANGDEELAAAVIEAFDISGDEGNITLNELAGPSKIELEEIKGYPIPIGFEESAAKFHPSFINDTARQRLYLENVITILYFGKITETQTVLDSLNLIADSWQRNDTPHNVVLVATGFSEMVLGDLAMNFSRPQSINVVPVLAPVNAVLNSQFHLLQDLSAFTGAKIFDPIHNQLYQSKLSDFGHPLNSFEMNRYKSIFIGEPDELLVLDRVDELKVQLQCAESKLESSLLQERIAKLTGGIVKLKISGSSNGEIKERRDRAEDAVCAVRSAIKHGYLPGGGHSLLRITVELIEQLGLSTKIVDEIINPSLETPVRKLLENAGLTGNELENRLDELKTQACFRKTLIFDAEKGAMADALSPDRMIVDALPAVLEAVRNSISIATLLGTLGGVVVFARDSSIDRQEANEALEYLKNVNQLH
jgi:chaperonin GroEL